MFITKIRFHHEIKTYFYPTRVFQNIRKCSTTDLSENKSPDENCQQTIFKTNFSKKFSKREYYVLPLLCCKRSHRSA